MTTTEVDIAVVGGGACGTMTALRAAANHDLTIAVLEKSVREGCNTQLSSGSLAAGGTRFQRAAGVSDSPELHAEDILAAGGDADLSDLVLAWCRAAPQYVEWLADRGYPLELGLDMPRAGMSAPRLHTDTGRQGGKRLIGFLRSLLSELSHVAFVDQAPVVDLLTGDHGVDGVVICQNGRRSEIRAKHVVLACDGFAASRDLMAEYCPDLRDAFYGGVSTSSGDAVAWLRRLGVPLRHMSSCLRHGLVAADHGTRLSPALPFCGAVLLDAQGRRFIDETSLGYSPLAEVIQRQPTGRATLVWDEQAMTAIGEAELMRESTTAGAYRRYGGLDQLAQALRLDPAALSQQLRPPGRRELVAPYYAATVTHGVLTTQGGAVIDIDGRVLTGDRQPVPGLRAGGGTAVGPSGPRSSGYLSGNGLLAALSGGWRIGNDLAAHPRRR